MFLWADLRHANFKNLRRGAWHSSHSAQLCSCLMPILSTVLQCLRSRRKCLVLWEGPLRIWTITLQAPSPDLGGRRLGSESHHVQEAAPAPAKVQWNELLFLTQLQVVAHRWVSSILNFSVPYLRSPVPSSRRWDFSCSPLGHIIKDFFPLQVCRITRKGYSLVEEVFLPPVEWHRSVIAAAHGCMHPSWWARATVGNHKPPWDTRTEKRGHGLTSNREEVRGFGSVQTGNKLFLLWTIIMFCFWSKVTWTYMKQYFRDHAAPSNFLQFDFLT